MVERCALSGSDLKIKFRTILLTSIYSSIQRKSQHSRKNARETICNKFLKITSSEKQKHV